MPEDVSSHYRRNNRQNISISLGFLIVLLFFIGAGILAYNNIQNLRNNSAQVMRTHDTILSLATTLTLMKDAETGQRGYILTGDQSYLQPYLTARDDISDKLKDVEGFTLNNSPQQSSLVLLRKNVDEKFQEMGQTIELRRTKGLSAAVALVGSDKGKALMDEIRTRIAAMQAIEGTERLERIESMQKVNRQALIGAVLTSLAGILLAGAVAFLLQRAANTRRREDWLHTGEIGIKTALLGEQQLAQLGENALGFFASYFGAQAGVFYVKNGNGYKRVASYAIPAGSAVPEKFDLKDGLLGQAVKDRKAFILSDVPEGYLSIGSSLGNSRPRHLIVAPSSNDDTVNAVLELGFLQKPDAAALQLLEKAAASIGTAVKSAEYRTHLQNLLEETQRQAEELQTQSEELRVSNEELEEQSRALKESQARLEQQQAELEQTNSQLEEQAQQLEIQKNSLERSNAAVESKAKELEQASQYKSNFLANMSHELRTPLNSSLILAKLLADNPKGNLSDEQVKFAQTIQSAGNDLLNLINDILDLSKIEAGHMDIHPETIRLSRLTEDLSRSFLPVAQQKNIRFSIKIADDCPDMFESDRLRVEQILRNLLSNAIKFTEKGSVELSIKRSGDKSLSLSVIDSGIGISAEQQQEIFEAFRQADGTISRKYGGTGLGLSISRELTRLLGGRIEIASKAGVGSTFTLTLPLAYTAPQDTGRTAPMVLPERVEPQRVESLSSSHADFLDDREKINAGARSILVVEDDPSFARIVYDLAHEMDFLCLIATTAEDALMMARQYLPSAVVLDIGLPDNSGLTVLDRLKRHPYTRHIPIHVVSAHDHAQTAMTLGAIGYMNKPIKRDDLASVLKNLEKRFSQTMRRVLLVEDDAVQRDSVKHLLAHKDVEIIDVGTAAACLEKLKDGTFDCMIMDLNLPDASGYTLLETLSCEDAYSFPPVIVYTGRDLTANEEQELRRYSKSIIIKGAKSPERLLDEVTLFLHQVISDLPAEHQKMLQKARNRDSALENRKILVVEDDMRNVYSLTNVLEPHGVTVTVARNGIEALQTLEATQQDPANSIDLVLMDVMMPEMDGLTATREIRKRREWRKLPVIMLTAKAMKDDQERCLNAGANDYMAKPLDVEKLLSLVRVWMPR